MAPVPGVPSQGHPGHRLLPVESARLQTLYVLFFIEIATRRVRLAGVTTNPDSAWVTQRARELPADLVDDRATPKFLLRDRDAKFSAAFDEVF